MHCISLAILIRLSQFLSPQLAHIDLSVLKATSNLIGCMSSTARACFPPRILAQTDMSVLTCKHKSRSIIHSCVPDVRVLSREQTCLTLASQPPLEIRKMKISLTLVCGGWPLLKTAQFKCASVRCSRAGNAANGARYLARFPSGYNTRALEVLRSFKAF